MHGGHMLEDEPMAEMNLIPLIDIALTLLIIMMVTTAFIRKPGVSLKLPETVTREGAPEMKKDLVVVIGADGSAYLDGVKQSPEGLQARLKQVALVNKEARILVKGDRDVQYAYVMGVMDMVRQAGLTRVVLPTDPKPVGRPGGPGVPLSGGTPVASNPVPSIGTPRQGNVIPR